ncbi:hypothetical protein BESB_034550 [Besnoitia besnoiti]|uniref:Uncharacterized protein n=1 Tax=Besnoitia besnoiti TaxID=94643 RepID=A0A2A9MMJ4_BESBE|nr:hypothetical protein BESB_034550 [Besnoitia besnoiti]PFH36997.1 hypothetical protein BESB_034550 [Besnoitia besnoiti]
MQLTWKQILLIAGGTAAAGACLYYLLREDGGEASEGDGEPKKINSGEATKEQVMTILKGILKSQEKTKALMKEFIKDMLNEDFTFEEAYERVLQKHPEDPLEQYGLTMPDFDNLLDKYQHDPQIKDLIVRIMSSSAPSEPNPRGQTIDKAKVIQVHEYMKQELQKLVDHIQKSPSRSKLDVKNVTLTAQAYVGAKVQKKFGFTSEDVESAVIYNHKELAVDPDFVRVNIGIQTIMNQLIVPQFVM